MVLSLTSKYAINALRYIAENPKEKYFSIQDISRELKIPGPYLSKLMKILTQSQIVESRRGASGGVRLPIGVGKLTYYDICKTLDDPIVNELCFLSKKGCNLKQTCIVHEKWACLRDKIHNFLKESIV